MITVFAVRPPSPVFDETSLKVKRIPMFEHLSNKFQNIYCRSIVNRATFYIKNYGYPKYIKILNDVFQKRFKKFYSIFTFVNGIYDFYFLRASLIVKR